MNSVFSTRYYFFYVTLASCFYHLSIRRQRRLGIRDSFRDCAPVRELLGEHFCDVFLLIKAHELAAYEGVISSWERDHLLLKV